MREHDYIVEEKSTDDDTYIKYNSGKLIMYGVRDYSGVAIDNRPKYNYLYVQFSTNMNTFPVQSIIPCRTMIHNYSNTGAYVSGATRENQYTGVAFRFYLPVLSASTSQHVTYFAVGKWK